MSAEEKNNSENTQSVLDKRTTGKYAILMESNDEEFEQWYYFIKVDGNEENLKYLQKQLEKIEWEIMEDLSTFDLELEYLVSAQTAKEMTKIDLNAYSFHRKFDGKLQKIDFEFKRKDGNETKMCKVFDTLGYGKIEEYVSDEDVDEEDYETDSTEDESVSESSEEEEIKPSKKVPSSILRERLREKILEEQDSRRKGTKKDKSNYDA
jgi:hypothetical protein